MSIPLRIKLLLWYVHRDKSKATYHYEASVARQMTKKQREGAMNLYALPAMKMASVVDQKIKLATHEIPIRIYHPSTTTNLPITMYFHGGGFVLGDLDSHDRVCRRLAKGSNSIVVSVDYRLAPEHPFPAGGEDCYAATCWVAENAESFGGDASRLAVAGDSAGANLSTYVALIAKEKGTPTICYQGLVYPATDFTMEMPSIDENATGYFLEKEGMVWFRKHYTQDKIDYKEPLLSPLYADLKGLPPATVITAGYDPLRDEGIAFAEKLKRSGVPTNAVHYKNMIHGFFNMSRLAKDANRAMEVVCTDLKKAFGA